MIVGGAIVAAIVSLISDAEDWHPPGPLFALFAFSGSASIPGLTLADAGIAVVVATASALFATLVGRNYGLAMVFVTPLALLAVHLATPTPVEQLLVDRLVESIVGALIGIAVGFATRRWGAAPR